MIYLDNAATTAVKPQSVKAAVLKGLNGDYGNPSRGAHDPAVNAFREIYRCREAAAKLFNVHDPLNVALTFNATDSLNRVIKGLFKPGDHVITTMAEHNSVLRPLYQLADQGGEVTIVGLDEAAEIKYDELFSSLQANTRAVVVTAASNVTGNGTDLRRIADFTKDKGILLIVDASQAAGVLDLDMAGLGIDILCTTGHKSLYGPQGTGLIAVNGAFDFTPVFVGGAGHHSFSHQHPTNLPDVFESGTLNTPGAMGLCAGMDYVMEKGTHHLRNYVRSLETKLIQGLQGIPGIKFYGNLENAFRTPTVGFNIGEMTSAEAAARLNEDYQIAVRPGAHCSPLLHESLRTVEQGIIRISISSFNTADEIDAAVKAIREISEE